jgi:hypothetical protein
MFELSTAAKLSLIFTLLGVIAVIVYFIIKERLKVELGILWIFAFIGAAIIILFENILSYLTLLIGGVHPTAGLSILAFAFIFLMLIILSAYLSSYSDRIKNMAQYISFLENRIRKLEKDNIPK